MFTVILHHVNTARFSGANVNIHADGVREEAVAEMSHPIGRELHWVSLVRKDGFLWLGALALPVEDAFANMTLKH